MDRTLILIQISAGVIEYKGLYDGVTPADYQVWSVSCVDTALSQIQQNNEFIKSKTKPNLYKTQIKVMEDLEWDFSKLPKTKHHEAIQAFNNRDISKLLKLHNQYKLSSFKYCCGAELDSAMISWWGKAIKENLIS